MHDYLKGYSKILYPRASRISVVQITRLKRKDRWKITKEKWALATREFFIESVSDYKK